MRAMDLCAGVGMWSYGFERAGIRVVAGCEIDPWKRAVYASNFPDARLYEDVRELTAERIGNDLGYLPEIIVGSPPCTEISSANSKGEGITDDHLFWEWVRLVFEVRPLWCAAENSPQARNRGIDGVLGALAQGGYAAWPIVVGALDLGAPHIRQRMWLVAADANRLGIREQPRRRCGTNWPRASEPEDDADTDEQGKHGLASDGEVGGELDGLAADASRQRTWSGSHLAFPELADNARHPDSGDGPAFGEGIGGDAFPQLKALERAVGARGLEWACGPGRYLELAHGDTERMVSGCADPKARRRQEKAANRYFRAIASAAGDAVVWVIPYLIARAMEEGRG